MPLLGVRDAAERLGVSTRQIQHLVTQGELTALARGVLDSGSVDRFLAVHGTLRSRAWSAATAWGAVALLSEVDASWMGGTQRSRLKARLRSLTAEELVERARARALVARFVGHSSVLGRVAQTVVNTAVMRSDLGLAGSAVLDGYLTLDDRDTVTRRFSLVPDNEGTIVLRATTFPIQTVREIASAGIVLTALDLAESLEMRERRAGIDALTLALDKFRG
ncbi:hypothetical protein [Puerhibacterium sp. TATVAM-FAB25]|uniref:hypothetical protein n=1 Tax=Puerhibacterium sp. TATVAM-FAB25 TaxID=3093699 RepID=UPI003978AF1A